MRWEKRGGRERVREEKEGAWSRRPLWPIWEEVKKALKEGVCGERRERRKGSRKSRRRRL